MEHTECPICGWELVTKDVYFSEPKSLPSNEYPESIVCNECGYWASDDKCVEEFKTVTFIAPNNPNKVLLDEGIAVHVQPDLSVLLVAVLKELKQIRKMLEGVSK